MTPPKVPVPLDIPVAAYVLWVDGFTAVGPALLPLYDGKVLVRVKVALMVEVSVNSRVEVGLGSLIIVQL